ncbi:MAG: hypothetical protein KDA21_04770, partial [Phycisphaerales bacterium]|nr:hypothetical protein [Phycisphaerales bacterium]
GPGGSTPGFGATMGHFPATGNALTGGYFTGSGVSSDTDPWGGQGVMIAQLSVLNDGTLWSSGVSYKVTANGQDIVNGHTDLDGAPESGFVARSLLTHDNVSADGMTFDVYQIWITQVPAPGGVVILLTTGLLLPRRRR